MLTRDPHPLADVAAFTSHWPAPLGDLPVPAALDALIDPAHPAGLPPWSDGVKTAVRDLLRSGGFKPNGRNKPCNEYIRAVAAKGAFPRINLAVDACNAAVLHGGLPISVVDLDRLTEPFRIGLAAPDTQYVFNRSGQEIRLDGLLCLFDADGPCSNAVKDAQRAKTDEGTTRTLSIVWGTTGLPGRTAAVLEWYLALIRRFGATAHVL